MEIRRKMSELGYNHFQFFCYCCFFFLSCSYRHKSLKKKESKKAEKKATLCEEKREKRWERKNVIPEHAQRRFESSGLAALYLFCVRTKVRCYLSINVTILFLIERKKKRTTKSEINITEVILSFERMEK
jgi:hypothetical protein